MGITGFVFAGEEFCEDSENADVDANPIRYIRQATDYL